MLNHIVLMGRLTRDPELRRTGRGVAVASFPLAVDRDFASQGGEKETDFVDIVAWRSTAEFVSKYFTKGRMAVVSGRLQIRNWQDKEGNKRRSPEVVADQVYFGDSKRDSENGGYSAGYSQQQGGGAAFQMLCHIFPRQNARRCQAVGVGLQPDCPGRGCRQQRHGAFFQQCLGGRVRAAPGPEVPRRLCKVDALRLFQPQRHTWPNAHLPALLYKNKE